MHTNIYGTSPSRSLGLPNSSVDPKLTRLGLGHDNLACGCQEAVQSGNLDLFTLIISILTT